MFRKSMLILMIAVILFVTACSKDKTQDEAKRKADAKGKPDTWIADRKLKGLVFQSDNDASPKMNKEVAQELKKKTGITLELQTVSNEDSTEALTSGLASGDLPDFIVYYLDDSGRPEMKVLNKAAKQGRLTDLTKMLKNTKIYSKYFKKGYLPKDTKDNIMFNKEQDGTHLVHMGINRHPGQEERRTVGGPYVRKDIMDKLHIDPTSIKTSKDVEKLAEKMKEHHFKDDNGKEITPIGPTAWGGDDRTKFYNDLVWTGQSDEKFLNKGKKIIHESQTEYPLKRVHYVKDLMKKGLMTKEFYTMEENKAKEGLVNGSWGIVSDLHNYVTENQSMKYVPLGPLNTVKGKFRVEKPYKSGANGWAVPSTTEHPEDVVKLADFLASRRGKLLGQYGIKGRDYTLDKKGNPHVKPEVLKEVENNPDEAKKRGFRGAGSYWADHLGYKKTTPEKIADMWHYDQRQKHAKIVNGLTVKSFLSKYEYGEDLEVALDDYSDAIKRAYYSQSDKETKQIIDSAKQRLEEAGLNQFERYVENQRDKKGTQIIY